MKTPAIQYSINIGADTITLYLNFFEPTVIDRSHASYGEIMTALVEGRSSEVPALLKKNSKIEKKVDWSAPKLKAQGAEIKDGKLFIDGREQVGRIGVVAAEYARKTGSIAPVKNFLERLDKNPSNQSKEEGWDFLQHQGLAIMPDGMVRGYKGVNLDGWSKTGNKNTRVLQGEVDGNGRIRNVIGGTIEVARGDVDDNRGNTCSNGLHVGTFEYARDFGELLLLVEFDPADIVSVPKDCNCQKLRCSKYKVLEQYKNTAPLPDVVKSYNNSEVEDYLYDLIRGAQEEIPDSVKGSEASLKAYLRSKAEEHFDELTADDFNDAVDYIELEISDMVESNSVTSGVVDIEDRVEAYVNKKGSTTIAMIQKSLNPTKVGCSELSGLVKRLGFKVQSNGRGISNWVVFV